MLTILSMRLARSILQYSNARKMLSCLYPTTTSSSLTILGCGTGFWRSSVRIATSLRDVIGKPSCSYAILICFNANSLLVFLSRAKNTTPYVPVPIYWTLAKSATHLEFPSKCFFAFSRWTSVFWRCSFSADSSTMFAYEFNNYELNLF